jgi:epoxyqueuosine reductase
MIALGNASEIGSVSVLRKALRDASPLVRGHAAWALGQISRPEVFPILELALMRESDEFVLAEMNEALKKRL